MITSIAEIRARYAGAQLQEVAPSVVLPAEAPRAEVSEAADWVATVGKSDITRTSRADGGYQIYVAGRLVVVVEGPDKEGRHVVVNRAAGRVRSPAIARNWADTLALRIARNEALT